MRGWWVVLLAGCGSKAAAPKAPAAPPGPRIALAEVDAAAFGVVHAASYLTVAADGALAIGAIDARGELDVSSLVPTPTEDLSAWYSVESPPIPLPPGEAGIFGSILGGTGRLGSLFGDGFAELGPTTQVRCGTALHLDVEADTRVALLIADEALDAHALLDVLDQMPRPVALVARGNDPRGRALRLVVDYDGAEITSSYGVSRRDQIQTPDRQQTVVTIDEGETAGQLLGVLGTLAAEEVQEVVIDLGATCTRVDMTGDGFGFGYGDDPNMWGEPPASDGGGWGTIGTGSGGGGSGYGVGGGGGSYDYDESRVTIGAPQVKDGANAAAVAESLDEYRTYLEECLKYDPEASGTVTVELTISKAGGVIAINADGLSDGLDACVEQVLGAILFDATDAPFRATVSIAFAP